MQETLSNEFSCSSSRAEGGGGPLTGVGFDKDDISDFNLFFLNRLVDLRSQAQGLGAFNRLQGHDHGAQALC